MNAFRQNLHTCWIRLTEGTNRHLVRWARLHRESKEKEE
jgi:hypothetical protein